MQPPNTAGIGRATRTSEKDIEGGEISRAVRRRGKEVVWR